MLNLRRINLDNPLANLAPTLSNLFGNAPVSIPSAQELRKQQNVRFEAEYNKFMASLASHIQRTSYQINPQTMSVFTQMETTIPTGFYDKAYASLATELGYEVTKLVEDNEEDAVKAALNNLTRVLISWAQA